MAEEIRLGNGEKAIWDVKCGSYLDEVVHGVEFRAIHGISDKSVSVNEALERLARIANVEGKVVDIDKLLGREPAKEKIFDKLNEVK